MEKIEIVETKEDRGRGPYRALRFVGLLAATIITGVGFRALVAYANPGFVAAHPDIAYALMMVGGFPTLYLAMGELRGKQEPDEGDEDEGGEEGDASDEDEEGEEGDASDEEASAEGRDVVVHVAKGVQ